MRELAHLTAALKAAGAPAFERYGVVVHLVHPLSVVEFERPVVAQAAQGVPPPVADGECVRPARELTPRQRRRRERGQQLAQQRKHRQQQQQQHKDEQQQQQQPDEEQQPEQQADSSPCGASSTAPVAPLDVPEAAAAPTPTATADSQLHDSMNVSPPRPKLVPRVLQLKQRQETAVGKRDSPATPSKASVADSSSPGSVARLGSKRLAVEGHT